MSVAVVTGGSAGVGRACVRELARQGYDVAILARDPARLAAAAAEVVGMGGRALGIEADVSEPDAVEAAAARVEAELGPIDVWVNNAMVTVLAPVLQLDPEEIRQVTEITYLGVVHGTQAALRRMVPRDRGTIVQVGSALAYRSVPLQAAYCAAKAASRGFTDALRAELLHDRSHVRITVVNLPAVNTPQFAWMRNRMARSPQPVPPIYQPEVAARAVAWAAEHAPRELDVGWPTVLARVGQALVPGLMDRFASSQGWRGQLTDDPDLAVRPDNLERAVRAPVAAHGAFDARARDRSVQLWAATHPRLAVGGLVGGLAAAMAILGRPWRGDR